MLANRTRAGRGALLMLLGVCSGALAESPAPPATAPPAAALPAPPALEIFGRLPAMRQVRLSPNGKLVAMEEEQAGIRKITIFEVDGGKTRHTVAVDEANKAVSTAESVRRFRILPIDWTEEGGQLTPSMKLRRAVVLKEFSAEVDALYS